MDCSRCGNCVSNCTCSNDICPSCSCRPAWCRCSTCNTCNQKPASCGCVPNPSCVQTVPDCSSGVMVAQGCAYVDPLVACEEAEEEDEVDTVCLYPAFLTANANFNMPACDETATFGVDDACRFVKGIQLFNEDYGYLRITDVNAEAKQVTVLNECLGEDGDCNTALPGTTIPAGTQFAIGIPFCPSLAGGSVTPSNVLPCLTADFVVPEVTGCIYIKVSNINGLVVGDVVSIASRSFRIGSIFNTTTIQICNDGAGGNEGDSVLVGDEDCTFPVIKVSSQDPCGEDAVQTLDRIIGCDGGREAGGEGDTEGQIFTWDNTLRKWVLKVLADVDTCLTLESGNTLDPDADIDQAYIFEVVSTTQLTAALAKAAPNVVFITIDDLDFCLTDVIDATHFHAIPTELVAELTNVPEGALVCIRACCDQCLPAIETCEDFSGAGGEDQLILYGTGLLTKTAVPGQNVYTLPASLETGDLWGYEGGAESLWSLTYDNSQEGCSCEKYLEILSNFQANISLHAELKANIELRILKTAPSFSSKQVASSTFDGDGNLLIAEGKYLSATLASLNQFAGQFGDRAIIKDILPHTWKGHIRLVVWNSGVGNHDFVFEAAWRVWLKVYKHLITDKYSKTVS